MYCLLFLKKTQKTTDLIRILIIGGFSEIYPGCLNSASTQLKYIIVLDLFYTRHVPSTATSKLELCRTWLLGENALFQQDHTISFFYQLRMLPKNHVPVRGNSIKYFNFNVYESVYYDIPLFCS